MTDRPWPDPHLVGHRRQCRACDGKGRLLFLGDIYMDCDRCNGSGLVGKTER